MKRGGTLKSVSHPKSPSPAGGRVPEGRVRGIGSEQETALERFPNRAIEGIESIHVASGPSATPILHRPTVWFPYLNKEGAT